MKRRDVLKAGVKLGIATNALPLLFGGSTLRALGRSPLRSALERTAGSSNNVLVLLQLQGGNDGLNCVIPYRDPLYKTLRPTLGVDPATVLPLLDHTNTQGDTTLGFAPAMTGMSDLYQAGKLAILQNVGYANPSLSHFRGTDIWHSATDSSTYASTGWLGRYLLEQNPGFPPPSIPAGSHPLAMQFGNALGNLFLAHTGGMGIALSKVPTTSGSSLHNYDAIPQNPNAHFDQLEFVRVIQQESEVYAKSIVDLSKTAPTNKATYPSTTLATQLASIARLVAGGITTRIFMVTQGSYDTHANQVNQQGLLLKELSEALAAFQQDLEALNLADRVALMTYSEFGRRPQENGSGTDHGMAAPLFVMGTQVRGKVYGNDPKLDAGSLLSGNLKYDPLHDFRNVYATVMNEWLLAGNDAQTNQTDIRSVLTSDAFGTYSTTTDWVSLGVFKGNTASYAASDGDAAGLALMQNHPNPAMSVTEIEFALPLSGPTELSLFRMDGVEVARVIDGRMEAGIHRVSVNVAALASGSYLYRLRSTAGEVTRRMVIEH